jgi:hypothetical protein
LKDGAQADFKKPEPKKPAAVAAPAVSAKKPSVLDRAPLLKQLSGSKDASPSPPSSPAPVSLHHSSAPAPVAHSTNNSSIHSNSANGNGHTGNGHSTSNGSFGNNGVSSNGKISSSNDTNGRASENRLEDLTAELHKMKTIILKHEMRIRELEKKLEQSRGTHPPVQRSSSRNGEWELLPDEV